MPFMDWNDNFSVGVKELDDQHTILFKMVNDLHDAMLKGYSQAMTAGSLETLINYTREHFAAEEAHMEAAHYPRIEQHRAMHRDLTRQVEEFAAQFERGEILMNLPMLNFLSNWLSTHILKADQAYGPWMKKISPAEKP